MPAYPDMAQSAGAAPAAFGASVAAKAGGVTNWLKHPMQGSGYLYIMLAQMLASSLGKQVGGMAQTNLQTQALQQRGEATTGEGQYYNAMMPTIDANLASAQQLLLQELAGEGGPQLATGEERIGGG